MTIYQKINEKTERYEYQNLKIFYQGKCIMTSIYDKWHIWKKNIATYIPGKVSIKAKSSYKLTRKRNILLE